MVFCPNYDAAVFENSPMLLIADLLLCIHALQIPGR